MFLIRHLKILNYIKIWEELRNDLDEYNKKMFLYRLKLETESRIEPKVINYKDFEEVRFEIRDNPEFICVEAFCSHCKFSNIYKVC